MASFQRQGAQGSQPPLTYECALSRKEMAVPSGDWVPTTKLRAGTVHERAGGQADPLGDNSVCWAEEEKAGVSLV